MLAKDYLQFLKDKIHSTVLATVDEMVIRKHGSLI